MGVSLSLEGRRTPYYHPPRMDGKPALNLLCLCQREDYLWFQSEDHCMAGSGG